MNTASLKVYHEEVKPKRTTQQNRIYNAVLGLGGVACNRDIKEELGLEINSITPRVNELVKSGKLRMSHHAKHPKTNRTVTYWEAIKDE